MPWYFDSQVQHHRYMRGQTCCAACGESDYGKLCIDHDRWKKPRRVNNCRLVNYPSRVLCLPCNWRKGNRRYVPFRDGTMWLPGKPVGWRTRNTFRKSA